MSAHGENLPDAESALDFLTFQVYADAEKAEDQLFAEKLDALLRMHSKSPEFVLFADTYRQACEDALSTKGVPVSRAASPEPFTQGFRLPTKKQIYFL